MFKRIIIAMVLLVLSAIILSGCSNRRQLLILNWGEYINDDVIAAFEEKYNVEVVMDLADSNELFYAKVKSGTTVYDLVVPSDYMIEKMAAEHLIQPIQFDLLKNYDPENLVDGLKAIMQTDSLSTYANYFIPYFWGRFGLMYNKQKQGLKDTLETHGWDAYFNPQLRPENTRTGMYDVPRFAYAASMFHQGKNPSEVTEENLSLFYKDLTEANFTAWGTDTLKKDIAANNLDLAFVYLGDFLDTFYIALEDESIVDVNAIPFEIYVPSNTMAFVDAFVIPTKARHTALAHQFIDFTLEVEMAKLNAQVVGYATPLKTTYDAILSYLDDDDRFLRLWSYATKTYYPLHFNGVSIPLKNISKQENNAILRFYNNARV